MAKRILIVDDEQAFLEMVSKRLKAKGYEVMTAGEGAKALEMVRNERPDLIISDLVMPGMDGAELGRVLHEDRLTRNIPVIFLTALRNKNEEIEHGPFIANHRILAKPFDAKQLLQQIEEIFSKEE